MKILCVLSLLFSISSLASHKSVCTNGDASITYKKVKGKVLIITREFDKDHKEKNSKVYDALVIVKKLNAKRIGSSTRRSVCKNGFQILEKKLSTTQKMKIQFIVDHQTIKEQFICSDVFKTRVSCID